jgi:hypothetical protein
METSNESTGEPLSDPTLFAVDTLASHSVPQVSGEEPRTHDTSGLGCETPLAIYDPGLRSWKTSEDISLWEEPSCLVSLPKSGTTRSGVLYLQPDWVRPIDATESSSWPTPTASEHKYRLRGDTQASRCLEAMARRGELERWPTPTTVDTFTPPKRSNPTLGDAARQADGSNGKLNPTWVEWLMGFPLGWTDLEDSGTPSSPKLPNTSDGS